MEFLQALLLIAILIVGFSVIVGLDPLGLTRPIRRAVARLIRTLRVASQRATHATFRRMHDNGTPWLAYFLLLPVGVFLGMVWMMVSIVEGFLPQR